MTESGQMLAGGSAPVRYAVACALTTFSEGIVRLMPLARRVAALTRGRSGLREASALEGRRSAQVGALVARLGWQPRDLPLTDGWAGSPDLLETLVDHVLAHRPRLVVEFGSGLSTLVIARALVLAGGGRLLSFDHNAGFAELTRRRLAALRLDAEVRTVDLESSARWGYAGEWYSADALPAGIDLLVIDGPPAWFREGTRGAAGPAVFPLLAPGGVLLLDDADRPGERDNARRWRSEFPGISFARVASAKGILRGVRAG